MPQAVYTVACLGNATPLIITNTLKSWDIEHIRWKYKGVRKCFLCLFWRECVQDVVSSLNYLSYRLYNIWHSLCSTDTFKVRWSIHPSIQLRLGPCPGRIRLGWQHWATSKQLHRRLGLDGARQVTITDIILHTFGSRTFRHSSHSCSGNRWTLCERFEGVVPYTCPDHLSRSLWRTTVIPPTPIFWSSELRVFRLGLWYQRSSGSWSGHCGFHGPLTRYVKLRVAHAPGMPGTFFPTTDFKGSR